MNAFFNHTYYNTYYYANIIENILSGEIELIGFVNNFFAQEDILYKLAEPFQKRSVFHMFIEHMISEFFDDDMHSHDNLEYKHFIDNQGIKFSPYADKVLEHFRMNDYPFDLEVKSYEDVERYHSSLYESGILIDLYAIIADEIFYIMFNNREALLKFNYIIAQQMDNLGPSDDTGLGEVRVYFNRTGFLKRVRIPEWCKKAVYFRDRGRCCFCHQDLSGTLSINNKKNYDHIIPLAKGGLNDVANLQLLCDSCNFNKSDSKIRTSSLYERWF